MFAQSLLRKMLSSSIPEKHYDVYFVVQQVNPHDNTITSTRLGAHRVVLCAASEKFEQHSVTRTNPEDGTTIDEILIEDCAPGAVQEALEIIYGGELRDSNHSIVLALDVWRFGFIFQVEHLIALARGSCLSNLSTDNCLRLLDFAVHVDDAQIVDKLQNYASENAHFSHVITSPDFERLDFRVISSLVRPGKGECAWPEILTFEKVWFDALVKWLNSRVIIELSNTENTSKDDGTEQSQAEDPDEEASKDGSGSKDDGGSNQATANTGILSNEEKNSILELDSDQVVRIKTRKSREITVAKESLALIEKVLDLVDFSRMKTHEIRDVARNEMAGLSPIFSNELVDVLLVRSEQLEASILERNIDLDVIGQKYQQALCEQDEAERKARAAVDKMDKLQVTASSLERRVEDMRRKKPSTANGSSGPASLNSARRKMSGSSTII